MDDVSPSISTRKAYSGPLPGSDCGRWIASSTVMAACSSSKKSLRTIRSPMVCSADGSGSRGVPSPEGAPLEATGDMSGGGTALGATTLGGTALGATALGAVTLGGITLGGTALGATPAGVHAPTRSVATMNRRSFTGCIPHVRAASGMRVPDLRFPRQPGRPTIGLPPPPPELQGA